MKKAIIAILLCLVAATTNAQFLFRISGKGLKEPSYMLGTIHTLSGSLLDSIPEYIEAEAQCRQLYAEQNLSDQQVINQAKASTTKDLFLPDSMTIGDLLTTEQFNMLRRKVREVFNKDIKPQANLKPSAFTLMFNHAIEAEAMKMYPEFSSSGPVDSTRIDATSIERAIQRGMTVGHLDDFSRMDSLPNTMGLTMELDASVDSLVSVLNNYDEYKQKMLDVWKVLAEITDCWMKGDYDSFVSRGDWLISSNPVDMVGRNKKWIPKMQVAMKQSPTMFVFGAAHLHGEGGIIAMLKDVGYKVKQVKRNK